MDPTIPVGRAVDADHVQNCTLKMNQGQAHTMALEAVQLLVKYHRVKNGKDLCAIRCCWESIIFCIKLMAGATGCPYDVMCWTVVTCLPHPYNAQAKQIHNLLLTEDWEELHRINFTLFAMTTTCMCTLRQMLKSHNHNCDDLVTSAVLLLGSTTPVIPLVLASLTSCGINVGAVLRTVDGVSTLVSKTTTVVLAGALKPTDINNLPGLIFACLGRLAGPALDVLNKCFAGVLTNIIGGVLTSVGGLLGGAESIGSGNVFSVAHGLTGGSGGIAGLTALLAGGAGGTGGAGALPI